MGNHLRDESDILRDTIGSIEPLYYSMMKEAGNRQDGLAKPPGSLGRLEDLSIQIAGITGRLINKFEKKAIVIMSADNGVVEEGVASAPQSVTMAQTINFTKKVTGVGALAQTFGIDLLVVDVGINGRVPSDIYTEDWQYTPGKILNRKISFGTRNLAKEDAMSREQAILALETGIELANICREKGYKVIGCGEMGIGNTTTCAAVLSALTGADGYELVGRGGGINDESFVRKKEIVKAVVENDFEDEIDILAKVGGYDIGAMAGLFLGAASCRIPIVIDGYISAVSALLAARICEGAVNFMISSHNSKESGYGLAIEELSLQPMLELEMRLGEGSGCPFAFQILDGANGVMEHMATFEEAKIDDDYLEEIRRGGCF